MASQRLSRLQRWILVQCYQRGQEYEWYDGTVHQYVLRRKDLLDQFYSSGTRKDSVAKNRANVSITRSIKNLFQKGFVEVASHVWILENTRQHLEVSLKELEDLKDKPDDYVISAIGSLKFTKAKLKQNIERMKRIVEQRSPEYRQTVKFVKLTPAGIVKAQELLNVKCCTRATRET